MAKRDKGTGTGTALAVASPVVDGGSLIKRGFKFTHDLVLKDGEGVEGVYGGPTVPASFVDDGTGEVREIPCHLIERDGVTFRVVAGTKLHRLLSAVTVGQTVAVIRLGNVELKGGRRMTDYAVGVKE